MDLLKQKTLREYAHSTILYYKKNEEAILSMHKKKNG